MEERTHSTVKQGSARARHNRRSRLSVDSIKMHGLVSAASRMYTNTKDKLHVLAGLRRYMDAPELAGADRCAEKLLRSLDRNRPLSHHTALVAYGGGKDSSFALAFTRLVQLVIFERCGDTFRLRVATNRHSGMPQSVYENIDRSYCALGLYDDPEAELLLIDGQAIVPFRKDLPLSEDTLRRNRLDILLSGHRTQGNPRPTFCNCCNLSLAGSIRYAASLNGGVDVIITGDSPTETRLYYKWIRKIDRHLNPGESRGSGTHDACEIFRAVERIQRSYEEHLGQPHSPFALPQRPFRFFSLFDDARYRAEDHWDLLTQFLQFKFDDLAFNFTETDCVNPALMAHMRGLRAERLLGGLYRSGIEQYVHFAVGLMRRKEFPEPLIAEMERRYGSPEAIVASRRRIEGYAKMTLGLDNDNIVCMLYSPFTFHAKYLDDFLKQEHPGLLHRTGEIRCLLESDAPPAPCDQHIELVTFLEGTSGLALERLQELYKIAYDPAKAFIPGTETPIAIVFEGDPHKLLMRTNAELEWISGR